MNEEEKLALARQITDALPAPEEIRDDWGKLIIDTVLPNEVGRVWGCHKEIEVSSLSPH